MDTISIITALYEKGELSVSELDDGPGSSEELMKNIWKLEKKGWIISRHVDEPHSDTYIALTMEGQHKAESMILEKTTKEGGNVTLILFTLMLVLMVVAIGIFAMHPFASGPGGQEAIMNFVITNDTEYPIEIQIIRSDGGTEEIVSDTLGAYQTGTYSYTVSFDRGEKSKDVTIDRTISTRYIADPFQYRYTYSVDSGGEYTYTYSFNNNT